MPDFVRRPCPLARLAGWLVLGVSLSGCAHYRARPLPTDVGARSVAELAAPTAADPDMPPHRFDPSDGLDVTELATLAVANNPALRSKRAALGIARAQAFAAGLLPDPQLSLGEDFPRSHAADLTRAFNLGLSADLGALLTRSSRVAAARAQARQVNLELLWAEWQTVAQARLLFDRVIRLRAKRALLQRECAALAPIAARVQAALRAGNLTHDSASSGLSALADARKLAADNAVALHQAEANLHGLLGLAPEARLTLVDAPYRADPDPRAIALALKSLPQRRPDLLALQTGYAAQEATLRGAIRAQFPAITLGVNTARDTSAIYTRGFSLGLNLPLFDRNRGNIAIASATREQLRDDYAARLLATRTDIRRLQDDLGTLDTQLQAQVAHARRLDRARDDAEAGWRQDLLDWPTYLAIRAHALGADLDLLDLRQQQATAAIALETLLGDIRSSASPSPAKTELP